MVGGDGGLGDLSIVAVDELLLLVVEVLAQDVGLGGADVELRPGEKVDGDLAVVERDGLTVVVVGDLDLEGRDADLDVVLHVLYSLIWQVINATAYHFISFQ